jgi:alpha-L-rhamnosidase
MLDEPDGGPPRFIIKPPLNGPVTEARATLRTDWGDAAVNWTRRDGVLAVTARVPWNCTAKIILGPGGAREVASGAHTFSANINQ